MGTSNRNSGARGAAPKTAGPATAGLSIAAKREKFYSGGIAEPFGYDARVIPLDQLTEEQVEELKADPYLIVKDVEIAAEEPAK